MGGIRYRYKNRAKQYERFISYFENKQKPKEIVPDKEISEKSQHSKGNRKCIGSKAQSV